MEGSPFNRSSITARSPERHAATPVPPPRPHPGTPTEKGGVPTPEVISTAEIQKWLTSIEQCLSEVCQIAVDGKLNSDQKLRIHNLCRKVGHGTSQIAVQYQSVKANSLQAHTSLQAHQFQADLSQRIKDLQRSVKELSNPAPTTSFADMVKKGKSFIQPTNLSSVAIYPNNKEKSSEETKSLVKKIICPEQLKLHVRSVHNTRNGGVIISTDTKDDLDKLKKSVQLTNSDLTIDEPYKRKPRVIIIGVPAAMQDKELFNCIYHQNLAEQLPNSSLETFLSTIKLSHKSGKKDAETCNYIIEVPSDIRKAMINKERVFVNWSSCPVRDFTLVTRCYKCQQYGHAAKSCREESYTCGHCGELGHTLKDCMKKSDEPKCATCMRFKKPNKHKTGATDCPARNIAEKRYINSVDYGGA